MLRRNVNVRLATLMTAAAWCAAFGARAQEAETPSARESILAGCAALFVAIEAADIPAVRAALAHLAMGQSLTLDSVAQLIAAERQIRYRLTEATVTQSGTTGIVRGRWERRFFVAGEPAALLRTGAVSLAFTLIDNAWRLTGFSGDNPFEHVPRR